MTENLATTAPTFVAPCSTRGTAFLLRSLFLNRYDGKGRVGLHPGGHSRSGSVNSHHQSLDFRQNVLYMFCG
jgi:hypothetical protein